MAKEGARKLVIDLNVDCPANYDNPSDDDSDFETDSDDALNISGNMVRNELVINQPEEVIGDESNLANVKDSIPSPELGMTFESYDEVISYYHEFGRQTGFQMRIRSCEKDGKRLRLCCSKEGKFTPRGKDPSKPTRTQVSGCKAKITATIDKNGRWKLTTVVLEHNHPLDPTDSRLMPNYRFINQHNKEAMLTNEKAGVPIGRNYTTFAVRYGGFSSVPFSEKDCRNLVSKHRRLSLQEGDFAAMEKLFLELSSKDVNFFYMYDTDDDGTLRNVFWADGRCRAAYRDFGDVVSFDATYLKNRYRMPFSPFIGVNHHGQSILLGCALLSGEETSNYVWLFKTWLACMSGKPPLGILTDQSMAIGNGIKEVLPHTRHRWCIWHIMRNAKKHLSQHIEKEVFHKDLCSVLHDSLSVVEFEERWGEMLKKYGLQENGWLKEMYNLRHRWVPIYFKDEFWAGMSSTQRSEGMNNFFKAFVNLNTTLKEFVEQYSLALGKRANEEETETFRSINKPTQCLTEYVAESVFQRLYTSKKFEEFQEQVRLVTYTNATKVQENGSVCLYDVVIKKVYWPRKQKFLVTLDRKSFDVECECKNFEFKGILCSHVVRVYHEEDIPCVPEKYILSRWRKDLPRDYLKVSVPYFNSEINPEAKRYQNMHNLFEEIATMAIYNEKSYSIIMDSLSKLRAEVTTSIGEGQELPQVLSTIGKVYGRRAAPGTIDGKDNQSNAFVNHETVKDPVDRRNKGRKPSKRKGYENDRSSKKKKDKSFPQPSGSGPSYRELDQEQLFGVLHGGVPKYSTGNFDMRYDVLQNYSTNGFDKQFGVLPNYSTSGFDKQFGSLPNYFAPTMRSEIKPLQFDVHPKRF